jgi:hypothetical protein
MAIPLTWRNLFVLASFAILLIGALISGVGTVVQWELGSLDQRLDDRLSIYHKDLDRLERRIEMLERK